jgi:hypothetical protein
MEESKDGRMDGKTGDKASIAAIDLEGYAPS